MTLAYKVNQLESNTDVSADVAVTKAMIELTLYHQRLAATIAEIQESFVIHGDIKDANIYVTADGGIVLGDFGSLEISPQGIKRKPHGSLKLMSPAKALQQSLAEYTRNPQLFGRLNGGLIGGLIGLLCPEGKPAFIIVIAAFADPLQCRRIWQRGRLLGTGRVLHRSRPACQRETIRVQSVHQEAAHCRACAGFPSNQ